MIINLYFIHFAHRAHIHSQSLIPQMFTEYIYMHAYMCEYKCIYIFMAEMVCASTLKIGRGARMLIQW